MKVKVTENFKAIPGLEVKFQSKIIRGPMMNKGTVIIPFDVFAGEIIDATNPSMIPSNCYVELKK